MAQGSIWERLTNSAKTIAEWDITALLHPKESGPYDFEDQKPLLEYIRLFYSDVASGHFEFINQNILHEIAQAAESLIQTYGEIQKFNHKTGDPNQNRSALGNRLHAVWFDAYSRTAAQLEFVRSSSGALAQEVEALRLTLSTIQKEHSAAAEAYTAKAKTTEAQVKERLGELDKVLESAREAAKIGGVAAQAGEFDKEARSALIASRWWLGASIGAVLFGLVVVWFMFLKDLPSSKANDLTGSQRPFSS